MKTPTHLRKTTIGRHPQLRRAAVLLCLMLSTLLLLGLASARAQIVVNSTGDKGNGFPSGSSTCDTNAFDGVTECTLRAAIEVANGNLNLSTITFNIPTTDPGYNAQTHSWTIPLGSVLPDLSTNMNVTGPGATKLTVQRTQAAPAFRIFNVTTTGAVNVSGLTIAQGYGGAAGSNAFGGGIQNAGAATVTLSKCTVRNNSASEGGAIANSTGTLTINNSTLIDNESLDVGGAIYNTGKLNISGTSIRRNLATRQGGGISNRGNATIINATVADNRVISQDYQTPAWGGGIYSAGTMTLNSCTISGNSSRGKDGTKNDPFTGNASGGGIFSGDSVLNVVNCTISTNSAEGGNFSGGAEASGGGIVFGGGTLNLSNSTLVGNSAIDGYSATGVAGSDAGGIITYAPAVANVQSTIIANNSAVSAPDAEGAFASKGFNLIGKKDGSTGFAAATDLKGTLKAPLDPELGPLASNGGPTQTMALLPGSPAIDKGTSVSLTGTLTTDQRGAGFPRKFDNVSIANASGGDGTDIGAFELQTP